MKGFDDKPVFSMKPREFYRLDPPVIICGRMFINVRCEFQVPNGPSEYVVRGIPEGGKKEESFVLIINRKGTVKIYHPEGKKAS